MKTKLIISSGQYEQAAIEKTVTHKTWAGLCRRITQFENTYAVYGDNWTGLLKASVALASDADTWGENNIIGGRWCDPANGWLTESNDNFDWHNMTYQELKKRLGL